jgi:hypothetical protein
VAIYFSVVSVCSYSAEMSVFAHAKYILPVSKMLKMFEAIVGEQRKYKHCSELLGFWTLSIVRYSRN